MKKYLVSLTALLAFTGLVLLAADIGVALWRSSASSSFFAIDKEIVFLYNNFS